MADYFPTTASLEVFFSFLNQSSKGQANNISEIIIPNSLVEVFFLLDLFTWLTVLYKHELSTCHRADNNSRPRNPRIHFCICPESCCRSGRLYLPADAVCVQVFNRKIIRTQAHTQVSVTAQQGVSRRFFFCFNSIRL